MTAVPSGLQSLEALDESGLGAERWMLLHFLLHQVPASRNFSPATAKMARQVSEAHLIEPGL